jgi:hypothetical protein
VNDLLQEIQSESPLSRNQDHRIENVSGAGEGNYLAGQLGFSSCATVYFQKDGLDSRGVDDLLQETQPESPLSRPGK